MSPVGTKRTNRPVLPMSVHRGRSHQRIVKPTRLTRQRHCRHTEAMLQILVSAPAMADGVTKRLCQMKDVVNMIEAWEASRWKQFA
jgi:hypothetical protein